MTEYSMPTIEINRDVCTQCEQCIDDCPCEAFKHDDGGISWVSRACVGCGICSDSCGSGALTITY